MPIRKPHVAGTFYPADENELRHYCETHLSRTEIPLAARAVILPHAGYIYSGRTACEVLKRVSVPQQVLLMGPNHTGMGMAFSVMSRGGWQTPLGTAEVDEELAASLLDSSGLLSEDETAHLFEHSLEVEIPFLQYKNPRVRIVPLTVGTTNLKQARSAAESMGEFLARWAEPCLIAVSTDMSHYENDAATRAKDRYALDAIGNLDAEALVKAVRSHRITMCGFVPVYMLLVMGRILNFQAARLVDYRTSADATGDTERVVGYGGFIFE